MCFSTLTADYQERETEETIPFTITPKRIKHLGINLTKEEKDPNTENCATDERNNTHKQEGHPTPWAVVTNTVKVPKSNAIYRLHASLPKLQTHFSHIEETILKSVRKHTHTRVHTHTQHPIAKATLTKKYKAGHITRPDFKLHYKDLGIKTLR